MSTTPRSAIPPPVDDPERTAPRAASFEETLDDTIDQSFPASDPPSSNPAPTGTDRTAAAPFDSAPLHWRHEGLLWAACGALAVVVAAAAFRLAQQLSAPRRTGRG